MSLDSPLYLYQSRTKLHACIDMLVNLKRDRSVHDQNYEFIDTKNDGKNLPGPSSGAEVTADGFVASQIEDGFNEELTLLDTTASLDLEELLGINSPLPSLRPSIRFLP
ncbi:hypothetical protein M231_05867 [Tremella mesenterica]|uniref:Uncharacterized protein n=1 Tax=Tremella mesenterica TaxID=5217 RepID=A0A4Q1BH30_TREME|nr:hypothetical protein M231_05867 [Tremella mesenterica]